MYQQPFNPYAKNLSAVKNYFKSSGTLILAVAQAAAVILSLATSIVLSSQIRDFVAYIRDTLLYFCDEANISRADRNSVVDFFRTLDTTSVSSSVSVSFSTFIIPALTVAAFLIIYFKSVSKDPNANPQPGFMILYCFAIISLIGSIFAVLGIFLIAGFVFLVFSVIRSGDYPTELKDLPIISDIIKQYSGNAASADVFLGIGIGLSVLAVVALFFLLFTSINRLRFYKSVKNSLSSVELQAKGARPYGVMLILSAIGSVFTLSCPILLMISPHLKGRGHSLPGLAIISILSTIASIVATFMEAKLALGYRKYIDSVKYEYNEPVPAAPYPSFAQNGGYFTPQPPQPQYNSYMPPAPNPFDQAPAFVPGPDADMNAGISEANPYGAQNAPITTPDENLPVTPEADANQAAGWTFMTSADAVDAAPATEAAPAPTCPLCGAEVDPDAPFCGNCGNRL